MASCSAVATASIYYWRRTPQPPAAWSTAARPSTTPCPTAATCASRRPSSRSSQTCACVEIKFYGAFVLNRRVDLHAIDAADLLDGVGAGCRFLTARRNQRDRVIADSIRNDLVKNSRAPDTLVDSHTGCATRDADGNAALHFARRRCRRPRSDVLVRASPGACGQRGFSAACRSSSRSSTARLPRPTDAFPGAADMRQAGHHAAHDAAPHPAVEAQGRRRAPAVEARRAHGHAAGPAQRRAALRRRLRRPRPRRGLRLARRHLRRGPRAAVYEESLEDLGLDHWARCRRDGVATDGEPDRKPLPRARRAAPRIRGGGARTRGSRPVCIKGRRVRVTALPPPVCLPRPPAQTAPTLPEAYSNSPRSPHPFVRGMLVPAWRGPGCGGFLPRRSHPRRRIAPDRRGGFSPRRSRLHQKAVYQSPTYQAGSSDGSAARPCPFECGRPPAPSRRSSV